jgi:hypothetical protein
MRCLKINPLFYSEAGVYMLLVTPIYRNVNFVVTLSLLCSEWRPAQILRRRSQGREDTGRRSFCTSTFDLDLLDYFSGVPDNVWTLILYVCYGVSFIEVSAVFGLGRVFGCLIVASVVWFVGCVLRRVVTAVLTGVHFGTAASDIVK